MSICFCRLNSKFGVPLEVSEQLAGLFSSSLDVTEYEHLRQKSRREARARLLNSADNDQQWRNYSLENITQRLKAANVEETDRTAVYDYYTNDISNETPKLREMEPPSSFLHTCSAICTENVSYVYEPVKSIIVALICDGELVNRLSSDAVNKCVGVVLQKSNFYSVAGGQVSDRGVIKFTDSRSCHVVVEEVEELAGYVIHWGTFCSGDGGGNCRVNDEVLSVVDAEQRLSCSQHHTATHLLHAALRRQAGKFTRLACFSSFF